MLFILSLLLLVFIFLFFSFYGSWWIFWPQPIKAHLAINRLAVSIYNNPNCRDFCYFEQLGYEKAIVESLTNKGALNRLFSVIFNEEDNLRWRLKVLDIILKNDVSNSDYFLNKAQEFIKNQSGSHQIKQRLILNFKDRLDYLDYLEEIKNKLLNADLSLSEAEESLSFLFLLDAVDLDFVLNFLSQANDRSLIKNIILKINNNKEKILLKDNSYLKYFNFLQETFLNFNSYDLRSLVVFSLSDFVLGDAGEDSLKLLEKLYLQEECDKFSKFLIANILNSYSEKEYVYPEIDKLEWGNYYNSLN
mgnify:FL=1